MISSKFKSVKSGVSKLNRATTKPALRRLVWFLLFVILAVTVYSVLAFSNPEFRYQFGTQTTQSIPPASGYGLVDGPLTNLSANDLDSQLNDIKATGVKWLRYDLSWKLVQPDSSSSYDWSTYDQITQAARDKGFSVLMIIDFAPTWAQTTGCSADAICAPADPLVYGKFAGAAAAHYKSFGVTDFEIWNEPNASNRFAPASNVSLYTRMLKDSYAAIKRANPKAVVITGATAPSQTDKSNYSPPDFIKGIYANGGGGWFDAVGIHPYTYPIDPIKSKGTDAWGQMSVIHKLMSSHGDGKKQIWATEFGAPTEGPDPSKRVTEQAQAQLATNSIKIFRSYSWAGPFIWYSYQDAGTTTDTNENFFGLLRADGSHKPAFDAFVQAISKP